MPHFSSERIQMVDARGDRLGTAGDSAPKRCAFVAAFFYYCCCCCCVSKQVVLVVLVTCRSVCFGTALLSRGQHPSCRNRSALRSQSRHVFVGRVNKARTYLRFEERGYKDERPTGRLVPCVTCVTSTNSCTHCAEVHHSIDAGNRSQVCPSATPISRKPETDTNQKLFRRHQSARVTATAPP